MTPVEALEALERDLRGLLRADTPARPFLCSGSPFGCRVALVGINPATTTSFWDHWSPRTGVDKISWLAAHRANARSATNQTRPRIEILAKALAPVRCIELNLFPYPTSSERHLATEDRDRRVFDCMLEAVQPDFLFAFGKSPALELATFLNETPFEKGIIRECRHNSRPVHVLVESHLSRGWSYERVRELAHRIKSHVEATGG